MTETKSPPRSKMALRVGVTGHRSARLAPDQVSRIDRQLEVVLTHIAEIVEAAGNRYAQEYAPGPASFYFVSALADGADTLAAKRALDMGWRLLAPLPFSIESYAEDFSVEDRAELDALLAAADAVAALDGVRTSPVMEERAYLQAGLVTVDQSDVIIAVWDGDEARGLGGTAMIKEEAQRARKPVIWINAVNEREPVIIGPANDQIPFTDENLTKVIDAIVAPPAHDDVEHSFSGQSTRALSAFRTFADETHHRINYGSFFQFFEQLFAGKWPFSTRLRNSLPREDIAKMRQSTLAQKLKSSPRDQKIFDELIIPRFVWADHLAVHYSNLYRSSYFFNYIVAAAAVFFALFDLVAGGFGFGTKTVWISIEVTLIVLILSVTIMGKRGRWHEKWIDYRQLAEEMRQYRLYYLTLGRGFADEITKGEGGETASWVDWYFDACRREAGMTSASFDGAEIRSIADVILNEEIRPQIAYHHHKANIQHSMEHRLHHLGEYAFGATLLVCLIYLTLAFNAGKETALQKWAYATKNDIKGLVTLLTGFLPSIGAAFFGIRVQGEFGSTAERSHATAAQLEVIAARFEELASGEQPRLEVLRKRVEEAARAMLMENMDWRLLYISKPLNLPG